MRSLKVVLYALCTLLVYVTLAPSVRADEWNKRTLVKFSEPVEVGGKVLQAGTYIFKLMDDPSDRDIVEIWKDGENGNQFVTTILAIPCTRTGPTNRAVFDLEERPVGSPMAIKEWFYAGDSSGQEFTY
jgi:hypothetical protein